MLTQADVSGPGVKFPDDDICNEADLASFRLITQYLVWQDSIGMRLDIKVGELQHARTLIVGTNPMRTGMKFSPSDPLIVPSAGVMQACAIIVGRKQLAVALRDLAEKLEAMR